MVLALCIYNGKRIKATGKLAAEAKWLRLGRIFVHPTPSHRLACAVSAPATTTTRGSNETLFPVGTCADRRNEIIYCVRPLVVDWCGSWLGRPRTRHARSAARRDEQPCPTVGRGTGNAFPTQSATDRQISTTSAVLPVRNTSSERRMCRGSILVRLWAQAFFRSRHRLSRQLTKSTSNSYDQ